MAHISAAFVTSATAPAEFPKERLRELALAGRSNVGKSSVINALVRQAVARTSAAPGKTRLANFYRVAAEGLPPFHLVDLPGYGYARGGEGFAEIAAGYFERPRNRDPFSGASKGKKDPDSFAAPDRFAGLDRLAGVLLLVDGRHPGLESDLQAWRWLDALGAPRRLIATKVDKLSRGERTRHLGEFERLFASPVVGVSARTGEGLKELWHLIETLLRPLPKKPAPSPPPPTR